MLLQGSLRQFNLPNILQLVKMSANTGALSLRSGEAFGKIFFSNGSICYAFVTPQSVPIGQRFVNARYITHAQLLEASALQRESPGSGRLGTILIDSGLIDHEALEEVVREQIQDTVFDFFSWTDGDFEFNDDEVAAEQDIFVEMQVESVIMESCRRIDELEFILEQLGSLESVPRLARGSTIDELGEVSFDPEEWTCAVHIDGHTDMNTIFRDGGFDRFHGAKIMRELFSRGLITVSRPGLRDMAGCPSLVVRGPSDVHCEVFLTTLTDGNLVRQLRVELIDQEEVEIPIVAATLQVGAAEAAGEGEALVFAVSSSAPGQVALDVAAGSSAWILLADARDRDSVCRLLRDVEHVKGLVDVPLVVAACSAIAGKGLSPAQVAEALGLGDDTPVLPCSLRDRHSVAQVFAAAASLLGLDAEAAEAPVSF